MKNPMRKVLMAVLTALALGCGVAGAHQPVVLLNTDTAAAKGPLLVDGTVSFAIRAAFSKAGEKKAFRAQFKEGDALEVQYLIVDKKPENALKSSQLPTVVITGPGGFKTTMKINEREKFYEPYGRTNYFYLARYSGVAKAGIYSFVITAKAKSAITLGVGSQEIPGEVVRGPYVAPTPTPSPTPTQKPTPTPSPSPSPTPTIVKSVYQRYAERDSFTVKNFDAWRKNLPTGAPESKIEYWFGSRVPKGLVDETKRRMDFAVAQWERFHKVSRSKIYLNLGLKDDLAENCQVMRPRSPSFTVDWCISLAENQLKYFFYAAYALESEGGWRPVIDPKLSSQASITHSYTLLQEEVFNTDTFFPRIEHEWIHQIQYDLTGNHYLREYPVWFTEGSAEYLGLLTASSTDPDYFFVHRATGWTSYDQSVNVEYFENWLAKTTVPRLTYTDYSDSLPTDGSPYRYGALATEWLVGKIGFQGLVSLMRDTESMGWAKAFEKHVGASQIAVRKEIATYMYEETVFVQKNRSWLSLPRCKSLAEGGVIETNKGVCFSADGRRP
jgi:hypothetical protein